MKTLIKKANEIFNIKGRREKAFDAVTRHKVGLYSYDEAARVIGALWLDQMGD